MQIKDTVALVTGTNRGIGRAFVEALLEREAAKVYAAARRRESLDEIVALDPRRVVAVELDVTRDDQVEAAAALATDAALVINNAGVLSAGSVLDAPVDTLSEQLDVNLLGPVRVSRAFAEVLAARSGALVNVLTALSLAPMPGIGFYSASKAAAWSLTQSLRADLASRGVTVHGVFPGPVDTDMLAGMEMDGHPPIEVARAVLDGVEAGSEDIFPDPMSTQVYGAWAQDHKAVERQFAGM